MGPQTLNQMKDNKLVTVTFTGIDDHTNLRKLVDIQQKYPFVEFGVLLSEHSDENGNRFPSLKTIAKLQGLCLNLSLHLCGRLAREAVKGDFSGVEALLGDRVGLFRRVQLNISGYKNLPEKIDFQNPVWIEELIIQQKATNDCALFLKSTDQARDDITVLFDASGGQGKEYDFNYVPFHKTGYAGGLNYKNVYRKLSELLKSASGRNPFWIDMESGVRTNDWFDIGLIEATLSEIERAINDFEGLSHSIFQTIWGRTQRVRKISEGVYNVTTASHGGIIVDDEYADRYLSAKAREYAEHRYGWYHFEEDCAWAIFVKENPALVREDIRYHAERTLLRYFPEFLSESLGMRFVHKPFRATRADLALMTVPFEVSGISDETMQAIVDEAATAVGDTPEAYAVLLFNEELRQAALRHGIPYKYKETPWIVTDDSCNQRFRARVLPDGKTLEYEYEQDGLDGKESMTITAADVLKEKDYVDTYLSPYGYKSISEMKQIYGSSWEHILAECYFEVEIGVA